MNSPLWKWPTHFLAILTGASDFSRNPVLGNRWLNEMGLHVARKRLAQLLGQARRLWLGRHLPKAERDRFDDRGYVEVREFVAPAIFQSMLAELQANRLNFLEMSQPPALTRRVYLDRQTCEKLLPATASVLSDRRLRHWMQYVAGYSGAPLIALQCVHTDATVGSSDPQSDWHVDTFHSTAKAWLYLHEVATDGGPTAYIPGSHRPSAERLAWERQQSLNAARHPNPYHARGSFRAGPEALWAMNYRETYVASVPANTLVIADTGGFHRRTPSARTSVRMEIYLSLRRNPFFGGLYPSLLGLPWLRHRWAGIAYARHEREERQGRSSWHPVGRQTLSQAESSKIAAALQRRGKA